MINDLMPSRVQMEAAVLQQLVAEVKETVATGIKMPEAKRPSFSVVDLWNVERKRKTAAKRSRRFV